MDPILNPQNNRKSRKGRKRQPVFDKPQRVFVGEYTTKSGQKKNRYYYQPVKVVKYIIHA